ncbi:cilia- and flagella-associated protein 46 [Gracilinanus agilis]|uniref:cilia- and flagella-associated protein 46 n=1 Tax=Gracilinanus agilis TaxID=191870 RepID=UPI001CFD3261|nr:cilia- and flagella-associated protein 46 [Gracilinanus agilis]
MTAEEQTGCPGKAPRSSPVLPRLPAPSHGVSRAASRREMWGGRARHGAPRSVAAPGTAWAGLGRCSGCCVGGSGLLTGRFSLKDVEALKKAYELIKAAIEGQCALDSSESFSPELAVLCAEQALQMKFPEITEDCVNLYFKRKPPTSQFKGRAYLCQAQLYVPESMEQMEVFQKAVNEFLKVIHFASEEPRYYFLVYNASVLYWKMARAFLKPGHRQHLIPSLLQIVNVLEQINEEDKDWQAELMLAREELAPLPNVPGCLQLSGLDPGEIKPRAGRAKLSASGEAAFSGPTSQDSSPKEKMVVWPSAGRRLDVTPRTQSSRRRGNGAGGLSPPRGSQDPGKMIEVECLEYELELLKMDDKILAYTVSAVEVQLAVIKRLNLALLRANRLGDPNVIQVVCATQWNVCLPLLQHNLRSNLLKPLLEVAEILEKIDSLMIVMRCQIHIEIAHIEEDEDRLMVAMGHLQKARRLDFLGGYQDLINMAYNRLRLCAMLYQVPKRMEDKAIMAIEEAKKTRPKDSIRKKRALLVNVGLALAPDAFQIVLDGENENKVAMGKSRRHISFLCAKARHHTMSVDKAEGHLKRLNRDNHEERIYIWADLAKVSRKQGVWDVCRTACRFCLLYDAMSKRMVKVKKRGMPGRPVRSVLRLGPVGKKKRLWGALEINLDTLGPESGQKPMSVDVLRTFAEVGFINAEAIIHFLRSEGIELNNRPIPPEVTVPHHPGNVVPPEEDAEWLTYSSWIMNLSQYAMKNWLRSAEIGQEINEAWLVHNTVVYVLNHNHHLILAGRQKELVELLQGLLGIMKVTGHNGDTITLVLLCNALARGLILGLIPSHTSEKGRKFLKSNQLHLSPVEGFVASDVRLAIEVCDYGLTLTNGNLPHEIVPISTRQQLIATWVKAKQLLQQQIGSKLGTDDEYINESQTRMTKVLVALEMYSCNGLGLMDFNLPSLNQVVRLASECKWTDPHVEIQSMVRLAHFAYGLREHEIVMSLAKKALSKIARHSEDVGPNEKLFRAELLSSLLCIQGKSIMENLAGRKHLRQQAAKAFLDSIRYGGLAGNHTLVMQSARHYWNTCFPFFSSAFCRKRLKTSIQQILKIINKTKTQKKCEEMSFILHQWPSMDLQHSGSTNTRFLPGSEDDTSLKTALYGLLFHMYADQNDLQGGLRVLEQAVQILPRASHRLLLFKHIVIVKAKLGQNFSMEIQKFKDTSEDYLSQMWHRLASNSKDPLGSLNCYYNAIQALQKPENTWQKISYLLEFSEWLYCNQFPINNVFFHLNLAIELLVCMKSDHTRTEDVDVSPIPVEDPGEDSPESEKLSEAAFDQPGVYFGFVEKMSVSQEELVEETSKVPAKLTFESLNNVRKLDVLTQAYTLLAIMSGNVPSQYENSLMAYRCVLRIWEVSLATVGHILRAFDASPEKDKSKDKGKEEEKDKGKEEEKDKEEEKEKGKEEKEKGKEDKKEKGKEARKEKGKEEKKEKGKEARKEKGKEKKEKGKEEKEKGKDKDKDKDKLKDKGPMQSIMASKPLDALPSSVEEWAFFQCPKDLTVLFAQNASNSTININTILKPNFSLYYLDQLVKTLHSLHLIHLTLPVLQLAVVICDLILESKTVSDLYHLRLAEVCTEIRLCEAAAFHEAFVGGIYINELEQARNEVRSRKEKRSEFLKEVATENQGLTYREGQSAPMILEARDKVLEINEQPQKGIQGVSFPYLWMYKAEVLLQMNAYQPAWLLLAEAEIALRELGDGCGEAKCLLLLAELAKKELKYSQAKKLIEKAHSLGGNEEFWYSSTVMLIKTLLAQEKGKGTLIPNIIQKTTSVFQTLAQERPNRRSFLTFLGTSLEAWLVPVAAASKPKFNTAQPRRGASHPTLIREMTLDQSYGRGAQIQLNFVLDSAGDSNILDFSYLLDAIYQRLKTIEKSFFDNGYKYHCVDVILLSVKIKRIFAKNEADEKQKASCFLEAYTLIRKAIRYLEEIFADIQSLLPLQETQNINTPLMRKLARLKLKLAKVSLEIMHFNQSKCLQENLKEGTWEKVLADYLLDPDDFTDLERDWFNLKRTVVHRALAQLESMQHLSVGCIDLRARFLHLTGKTLHLLAIQTDPVNKPCYWDENFLTDHKIVGPASADTDKEETEAVAQASSQSEDQVRKGKELKKRFTMAQKFRAQASEVLLQCLQVSLSNNLMKTAAKASLEVVESIGAMDQPLACQFMALYQSCSASVSMRKLLYSVTTNTCSSQLASLIQLHQKLQEEDKMDTTLFNSVEQSLMKMSKVWQNLNVSDQHFNILSDLPLSYRILILQHSDDRSILYGMIYEKPKFAPGPKGKMVQISISENSWTLGMYLHQGHIPVGHPGYPRVGLDTQTHCPKVMAISYPQNKRTSQEKEPRSVFQELYMEGGSLGETPSLFSSRDMREPSSTSQSCLSVPGFQGPGGYRVRDAQSRRAQAGSIGPFAVGNKANTPNLFTVASNSQNQGDLGYPLALTIPGRVANLHLFPQPARDIHKSFDQLQALASGMGCSPGQKGPPGPLRGPKLVLSPFLNDPCAQVWDGSRSLAEVGGFMEKEELLQDHDGMSTQEGLQHVNLARSLRFSTEVLLGAQGPSDQP